MKFGVQVERFDVPTPNPSSHCPPGLILLPLQSNSTFSELPHCSCWWLWMWWEGELVALAGERTVGLAGSSVSGLQVSSNSGRGCAQKCSTNDVMGFFYL